MKFTIEETFSDGTTQVREINADAERFNYSPLDVLSQLQRFEGKRPEKVILTTLEKEE